MGIEIKPQKNKYLVYYLVFGIVSLSLMFYYLSNTLIHFTTPRQFSISSFDRYPLTWLIFPAEVFSFLFAVYFVYTLISDKYRTPAPSPLKNKEGIEVAVLLPSYNEPEEILDRTINSCKKLKWQGKVNIYLLDDSNKKEYQEISERLVKKYNINLVRREDRIGYKAGNINNAIKNVITEPYFVTFDSDQAPDEDFLEKTMDHFSDETVGFVQTPQHFIEANSNLERATKLGSDIFYRTQIFAKSKDQATPYCGTNVIVRTSSFREVKGFSYYTATEDIDLGMRINSAGYKGIFVPIILVNGYCPPDFSAYKSQQYRWANGNMAILREYWYKLIGGNFPFRYKVHMLFTLGWWAIGLVSFAYILVPIISLIFGIGTHHAWLPGAIITLLYVYVLLGISLIFISLKSRVRNEKVTISDALIQYSLIVNSAFIYARAAINALVFKKYVGFIRTNKQKSKSSLSVISLNLILATICFGVSIYALYMSTLAISINQLRTYLPISLWLLFYSLILFSSILFVDKGEENKK